MITAIERTYSFLRAENEKAFAVADFDRAYHLLAAAVHLAQAARSSEWLKSLSERGRPNNTYQPHKHKKSQ